MNCKYCLCDDYKFFIVNSPCLCKNNVHVYCLFRWYWTSKTLHCPECKYKPYYLFTQGCLDFVGCCKFISDILLQKFD